MTGSLVAKAIHADIYENWTDVSGFLVTDPRIVEESGSDRDYHISGASRAFLYGSNCSS